MKNHLEFSGVVGKMRFIWKDAFGEHQLKSLRIIETHRYQTDYDNRSLKHLQGCLHLTIWSYRSQFKLRKVDSICLYRKIKTILLDASHKNNYMQINVQRSHFSIREQNQKQYKNQWKKKT